MLVRAVVRSDEQMEGQSLRSVRLRLRCFKLAYENLDVVLAEPGRGGGVGFDSAAGRDGGKRSGGFWWGRMNFTFWRGAGVRVKLIV